MVNVQTEASQPTVSQMIIYLCMQAGKSDVENANKSEGCLRIQAQCGGEGIL